MLNRIEKFFGSLVISILISLLLFALIDAPASDWLRRSRSEFNDEFKFKREAYFEPRPYSMFGGSRIKHVGQTAGLNSMGSRGAVPEIPKPSNEYRIIMLGGSTVLMGNPTLAEIIEAVLAQGTDNVIKVYNFGVAASILRMDIARLIFDLNNIEPDLILFYGGGNDIIMPFQADPRPNYPPNYLVYENNPLITAGTSKQDIALALSPHLFRSKLIATTIGEHAKGYLAGLPALRQSEGWGTEAWSKRIANSYVENLGLAKVIGSAFKAKSFFVFQPMLYYKNKPSLEEESNFSHEGIKRHAVFCRREIIDQVMSGPAEIKEAFLDLSGIFDSESRQVYTDGIHLKQDFYQPVASQISGALQSYLKESKLFK